MFSLRHAAAGYFFERIPFLHDKEAVHRDEKGVEVSALLEASLHAFLLLLIL